MPRLLYDERHAEGPQMIMKEVPREFFTRLKALDFQTIKHITDGYLTDTEIQAVLARKDLIVEWITDRIQRMGEDSVLY